MRTIPRHPKALCLLLCAWLLAGAEGLEAQPRNLRFDRITPAEGLSQSSVIAILQSRDGFMWLGTQEGLNRYDGHRFTIYRHDPKDPASLPDSSIQALYEDPSGDLWIGTEGGGLSRWQHASDDFVNYRHDPEDPQSLPSNRIRAIVPNPTGGL
ncbi:MAG: two-component regulator propeller domain-containing protein, partial [Acidobacteriota bacterium]